MIKLGMSCVLNFKICVSQVASDAIKLIKTQEARICELEKKLRVLEYGDQDILQGGIKPAHKRW